MASSLEKLKSTHEVDVRWRSFELRPAGAPPISPEYRERILATRPQLNIVARDHYGIELNPGPFGINSRYALIGAKFAEEHAKGEMYQDAVFRAYWQEGRDISDVRMLCEIATRIGLDEQAFLVALTDSDHDSQVQHDINAAHAYRISGVPAMIFAQRYLISGSQTYDALCEIIDQIQAGME